jgi:tRNA pseudouridine13 synthase
MSLDPLAPLPLATHALAGIGGRIKEQPEDFEVEEIPAYEPCCEGPFLYLWIEKRDMGAEFFLRTLARRLNLPVGELGTAGMKDRRAVTRQMVSVPLSAEPVLPQADGDGIRLLRVSRHTNKLRAGHLRGNRFSILIRATASEASARLPALIEALARHGFPNFYGPQRMGKEGETAALGLALLRGERPTRGRPSPFLRRLAVSAAQSLLFNHWLEKRLQDGLFGRVLLGDVMSKLPFGGLFVVEDLAAEQARFESREIVYTGPMFGRKLYASAAVAREREDAVLAEAGLELRHFFGFGKLLSGTRRAALVYPDDLQAETVSEGVRLRFVLPAGSYATVLLGEIMKTSLLDGDEVA